MRLRVVDYIANPGGGVRFAGGVLHALLARTPELSIEIVSHGDALARYAGLFPGERRVHLRDLPPVAERLAHTLSRFRGGNRVMRMLDLAGFFKLVPQAAMRGADVLWLPWTHRHRLHGSSRIPVVGSFHDAIMLERHDIVAEALRVDELETTRRWLRSPHRVVVSSRATMRSLRGLGLVQDDARLDLVAVGSEPLAPAAASRTHHADVPERPYLLCAANTSPHKNHEVLLQGWAESRIGAGLVLTGEGTDLRVGPRAATLRALAERLDVAIGASLLPIGYVDEERYRTLLDRAWAVVMPTLAEGGGSFPVLEAMLAGVPVVCSRIPVMEEQLERTGGSVLWFDPRDPADLARRLRELERDYANVRALAQQQRDSLRVRRWDDVAGEYMGLFTHATAPQ